MAKKSVNDPESLGWTDDGNGFWSWSGEGSGGAESAVLQDREEDQQVVSKFSFTGIPESLDLGYTTVPNRFVVDTENQKAHFQHGLDNSALPDAMNPWNVAVDGSLTTISIGFPFSTITYDAFGLKKSPMDFGEISASIVHRYAGDPDNIILPDDRPERWIVKPNLEVEGDGTFSGSVTASDYLDANGNSIVGGTGGGSSQWDDVTGGIAYMDGNVGVGTNDPSTKLDVMSGTASGAVASFRGYNATRGLEIQVNQANTTTDRDVVFNHTMSNGHIVFGRAGTDSMRIDGLGNVGVGVDDPNRRLHVKTGDQVAAVFESTNATKSRISFTSAATSDTDTAVGIGSENLDLQFYAGGSATRMTIDSMGLVGIGMAPATTTFDLPAKEQLAEWKTKAKKASWPIVTDGAFEQEPTEDLVEQWIETRAAGDKLQVNGGISADTMHLERALYPFMALRQTGSSALGQLAMSEDELHLRQTGEHPLVFLTDNEPRLRIEGTGNAQFYGTVTAGGITAKGNAPNIYADSDTHAATVGFKWKGQSIFYMQMTDSANGIYYGATKPDGTGFRNVGGYSYTADQWAFNSSIATFSGDATFAGTVSDGSGPLMSKRGLITTLSTLRNATKDETTLEGLRDSIGNAIGGLIEKFEAEIAAMPAPETGTMETLQ